MSYGLSWRKNLAGKSCGKSLYIIRGATQQRAYYETPWLLAEIFLLSFCPQIPMLYDSFCRYNPGTALSYIKRPLQGSCITKQQSPKCWDCCLVYHMKPGDYSPLWRGNTHCNTHCNKRNTHCNTHCNKRDSTEDSPLWVLKKLHQKFYLAYSWVMWVLRVGTRQWG